VTSQVHVHRQGIATGRAAARQSARAVRQRKAVLPSGECADDRCEFRGSGQWYNAACLMIQNGYSGWSKLRGLPGGLEFIVRTRSVLKEISTAVRNCTPKYDTIGRHRIRLATGSRTLEYKRKFRLYDTALGHIANVVRSKYPDLYAVDIGANVGDTAALIRNAADIPVLCVEGDATLLPILMENTQRLGADVVIEPSFVGSEGQTADPYLIDDAARNASLVEATKKGGSIKLRSLRDVLKKHPAFSRAKLLKTDTEGFDFDILRESLDFLRLARPIIFFEYDPHFRPNEPRAGLETIGALINEGYSDFVYYDNFGNLLLRANAKQPAAFVDLDAYLASNRRYGTVVYYFDVCAFHRDDADLALLMKADSGP
jgi:FkbM family methyltransferase